MAISINDDSAIIFIILTIILPTAMLSHQKSPFTNTASGNMLKKQEQGKYKQIDLGDLDVEMISPQFLQLKTLKKPWRQNEVSLNKTNPSGLQSYRIQQQPPVKDYPTAVIFKKDEPKEDRKQHNSLSMIDASALKITPAYKKDQSVDKNRFIANAGFGLQKDSNTILAAILKKGLKPEVVAQPNILGPKEEKKVGPAEAKLRSLIGKKQPIKQKKSNFSIFKTKEEAKKSEPSQIGEQIGEDIDEYGYESFQKLSGAYQSAVRESIVGESNIKESIRESIRESLVGSSSRIRESIREQIRQSLNQSVRQMREEIIEEISVSAKRSKESIEEVYEEIFEDQNSNSMGKNQGKFKKSNLKESESFSQSQSASKSFRMKTNVAKSMRLAEEVKRKQVSLAEDKLMSESLSKQKENIKKIRENIAKLLKKQKKSQVLVEKNKDLYYNFKVEINRLINSDNFESKLKKLSSFLSIGNQIAPSKDYVNQLEDNILKTVLTQIQSIKMGRQQLDEIGQIKREYENKLQEELRIQSVNLRAEMNQKLSEKDLQLRKMIADLESRLMSRTVPGGYRQAVPSARVEQYEIQSDYSIDSDNISWKADLWELLPEFEKKKLYEKQTAQVTKFLADVMINELKEEALERSIDISFQFPQGSDLQASVEANVSSKSRQASGESGAWQKQSVTKGNVKKSEFLGELPSLGKKNLSEQLQSSRQESPVKFERTRKDDKLKPEIIKILSDYKTIYLRKKQEAIRKLLRAILSREKNSQAYLYSSLQEVTILGERQYKKQHQLYIRAYEEELLWSLVGIYNRCLNKKQPVIEEEMKKMYDRLVVVCQVSTADKCTERIALDVEKTANFNVEVLTREALRQMEGAPCAIEIVANQNYMDLKSKKQERQIQSELVEHIINILSLQFSKEFPARKK